MKKPDTIEFDFTGGDRLSRAGISFRLAHALRADCSEQSRDHVPIISLARVARDNQPKIRYETYVRV